VGVMDVTDVGSKKWLGGVSSFTVIAPPTHQVRHSRIFRGAEVQ